MYTLHNIGSELLGFCHYLKTFPDLLCIVGLKELTTEVGNLFKLTNNVGVFSFLESYKVGTYTITPFSFIHVAFTELPCIPLYFLISENVDFHANDRFLSKIFELLVGVNECHTAVITNQNYNFTSPLSIRFPNWMQVYEWELLFATVRTYLRGLNNDIKVITVRVKEIKILLNCNTFEIYATQLSRMTIEWPFSFSDYYNQILREPIETRLGRWILER